MSEARPDAHGEEWFTKAILVGVTIERYVSGNHDHKYRILCREGTVFGSTPRRCFLNFISRLKAGEATI